MLRRKALQQTSPVVLQRTRPPDPEEARTRAQRGASAACALFESGSGAKVSIGENGESGGEEQGGPADWPLSRAPDNARRCAWAGQVKRATRRFRLRRRDMPRSVQQSAREEEEWGRGGRRGGAKRSEERGEAAPRSRGRRTTRAKYKA